MADQGLMAVFYFDESGVTTMPSVPYAWQPIGAPRELPCFKSRRLNILGFLSKDQRSYFHYTETPVNTEAVIAAFDGFTARYAQAYAVHRRPCVVIIDNASTHTSQAFREHQDRWGACGVIIHRLPPYSPELNLIEILWRKLKYDWLPLDCYASFQTMKQAVQGVLSGVGSKYQITFD